MMHVQQGPSAVRESAAPIETADAGAAVETATSTGANGAPPAAPLPAGDPLAKYVAVNGFHGAAATNIPSAAAATAAGERVAARFEEVTALGRRIAQGQGPAARLTARPGSRVRRDCARRSSLMRRQSVRCRPMPPSARPRLRNWRA